jgi:DNA polymerase
VLWRLTHGEPKLLEIIVDPDVHELSRMDKAVRHDVHKMRAFVRFRRVTEA